MKVSGFEYLIQQDLTFSKPEIVVYEIPQKKLGTEGRLIPNICKITIL